jgi:hypothetical protein
MLWLRLRLLRLGPPALLAHRFCDVEKEAERLNKTKTSVWT